MEGRQGQTVASDGQPVPPQEMKAMKMLTYVNFAGTCADAFRFYEKHLGGRSA